MLRTSWLRTVCVFGAAFVFLLWIAGHRLVLVNDEGIYLDGALRMLHGAAPYRDFFVLTGPGSFWNIGAVFRLFGVSLFASRILLAADMALICACLYWTAATCISRRAGLWLSVCYAALVSADAANLVVNHRWDSAALSFLACVLVFSSFHDGRWWRLALAGALASYAAWVTPPLGLVGAVLLAWVLWRRGVRSTLWFGTAGLLVSAFAVMALVRCGAWPAFLQQFLWTATNYSSANRFAYGAVIGGYGQLFEGAGGLEYAIRAAVVVMILLPALAPLLAASAIWRRDDARLFWFTCAGASVAACYPRMDIGHLAFAAPLSYLAATLAVVGLGCIRLQAGLAVALTAGAAIFGMTAIIGRARMVPGEVRSGRVVGQAVDLRIAEALEREVRKGDTFFAFPYFPLAYFLTQASNPTRYSFLQPGMMAEADQLTALRELERSPPAKILYQHVSPEAYLRLFPSSDPARLRMEHIELWLERNYEWRELLPGSKAGYRLLTRRPRAS